eukprot:Gb_37011 [translate_table: standard]
MAHRWRIIGISVISKSAQDTSAPNVGMDFQQVLKEHNDKHELDDARYAREKAFINMEEVPRVGTTPYITSFEITFSSTLLMSPYRQSHSVLTNFLGRQCSARVFPCGGRWQRRFRRTPSTDGDHGARQMEVGVRSSVSVGSSASFGREGLFFLLSGFMTYFVALCAKAPLCSVEGFVWSPSLPPWLTSSMAATVALSYEGCLLTPALQRLSSLRLVTWQYGGNNRVSHILWRPILWVLFGFEVCSVSDLWLPVHGLFASLDLEASCQACS